MRRRLLHEFSTWSKELTKAEREVDARAAVGAGQDTAAGAGAGVAAPLHAPPVMRGLSSETAYRSLSPQRVADSLEQDGPVQAQDEDMAALMACLMQELPESDRVELLRIIKLGLEEALASTDSTLTSKRDDLQDIIDKIKRLCL